MKKLIMLYFILFSGGVISAEIKTYRGEVIVVPDKYVNSLSSSSWGDKSRVLSITVDSSIIELDSHYGYIRALIFYDKDYDSINNGKCSSINSVMSEREQRKENGVNFFYEKLGDREIYYYSSAYSSLDSDYSCDRSKDFLAEYRPAKDFVAGSIVRKGVSGCTLMFNYAGSAISLSYNGKECRYDKYSEVVKSFRALLDSWMADN